MATFYWHADPRQPYLWEHAPRTAARWHTASGAPAAYLASTPDGAWAEFLRHEAITDPADLPGIARRLWAVEVPDDITSAAAQPELSDQELRGGPRTYSACQSEAARQRGRGALALRTVSAALLPGAARGQQAGADLHEAGPRDGEVLVLYGGHWPQLRGWTAADAGTPTERTLHLVRHLLRR